MVMKIIKIQEKLRKLNCNDMVMKIIQIDRKLKVHVWKNMGKKMFQRLNL